MDKLSERLAVVGVIDPDAQTSSGVIFTDAVDMADFGEALFIVLFGEAVSTSTVDFAVWEDTISGTGTGGQAITGKSITQLTSGSNDNQALVHVRADDLSRGYRYLYGRLNVGTEPSDVAVVAIGGAPRFHPASDYDLASVAEIVD